MLKPEFVENPEPRCPVALVLDVSKSMAGAPLMALNDALASFKYDVERDVLAASRVEVALITFGEEVTLVQDFTTVDHFTAPVLEPYGSTPLGGALELALDRLEARKAAYRAHGIPYYRPWVMVLTDGAPTDHDYWPQAAQKIREAEDAQKLHLFAVGVGDADLGMLRQITAANRPPLFLKDLKFRELFLWLSASMRRVSTGTVGEQLALPPVDGWALLTP